MDHLNVNFLSSPFVREVIESHRQLDDEAIQRINDNHAFYMNEIEQRMTNCVVCLVKPRVQSERCGHSQVCQECSFKLSNACPICDQKSINL